MASLQEGFLLCNSQENLLLGITISSTDNHVIITQNNRRIRVYNVADQKLFHDWPAKTGQLLTCPCVQSSSEAQFSVIIDGQLVRTWARDDLSVDKGHKTKLPKPAHRLFSFKDGIIVLYADGSIGSLNGLLYEAVSSSNHQQIVWCDAVAENDKNYIIVIFSNADSNQYLVRIYSLNLKTSSVYAEITKINSVAGGRLPISFCLQSVSEEYFLIALYSSGHLSRTRLLPDILQTPADADELCPLPIVNSIETGLAVVAIDSAQVAVVSPASRDDQRMGLGIWDVRFGIFHSWISLPDIRQSNTLVFSPSGHLIVPCGGGVYVYPIITKPATLACSLGKLTPVTSKDENDIPTEVYQTLHRLAQPTDTPTRSSFKKAFGTLEDWLPQCSVDSRLKIRPAVTAVIQRCVNEKQFMPTEELLSFVDAHVVTQSACGQLCTAFAACQEVDALLTCLTKVKDVPESSIVTALSCFLSVDDCKFTGIELAVNGHEEFDGCPPAVFKKQKAAYVNRVLTLEFNSSRLLEALHELQYTHVVDLIRHLEYLLHITSATASINYHSSPSLAQVVDWLSLLIDARYAEVAMSKDVKELHSKLQCALQLQRQDMETLLDINRSLLQILRTKKEAAKKRVGTYCITVLRMN